MRLALRVDDTLELAQHLHARDELMQAAVRLALILDCQSACNFDGYVLPPTEAEGDIILWISQ